MAEKYEEQPVFTLPEEYLAKMEREGFQTQPAVEVPSKRQIKVKRDTRPLSQFGEREIMNSNSGPMIVRKRKNTALLYHKDGRTSRVPLDGVDHYLEKTDKHGEQTFFSEPQGELPKNERICAYCLKKFRSSTVQEMEANSNRSIEMDEETVLLLEQMGQKYPTIDPKSINDVDFKLAEHIRSRHGKLAAFSGDPMYQRLKETSN